MVPWFALAFSQFRFRKRWGQDLAEHNFKSKWFPISNYIIIVYLILVIIGMAFNPDTRLPLIVGATFMAIVVVGYYVFGIGGRQSKANDSK